jgi:hypothetical protein
MNELERLIAAIARPEPSGTLDERVQAILAHEPPGIRTIRWRSALVWCCASACIGLIGFCLGRQSVGLTMGSPTVDSAALSADHHVEAAPGSPNIMKTPLREDQLAGLFLRAGIGEGMLGTGPVTIEISKSH